MNPKYIWTDEQLEYLRKYYSRYSTTRLSQELQISVSRISNMAKKEGLKEWMKGPLWMKGDPLFRFWRQYEIEYLKKHYHFGDIKAISWEIGRTVNGIHMRAELLNIKRATPMEFRQYNRANKQKRIRYIIRNIKSTNIFTH